MTDISAPFPEQGLKALAQFHDSVALTFSERSYLRDVHERRATICRDALAAHIELRERCLVAELELGQARRIAS